MRLTDFEAMSFDCYGTLIDWETGMAAVLHPWARRYGLDLDDDQLMSAYSSHELQPRPNTRPVLYPEILGRSLRGLGERWASGERGGCRRGRRPR